MTPPSQPASHAVYEARAFGPPSPALPRVGQVRIELGELRFVSTDGAVQLDFSMQHLRVEVGGWDRSQIAFTHPSHPEWSVFVNGAAILSAPELAAHPALAGQSGRAARGVGSRRSLWLFFVTLLLLIGLPIGWVVMQRGAIARSLAEKVPVDWEQRLGEDAFTQIRLQGQIVDDPVALKTLERVTGPLLKGIGTQRYAFQFHISKDTNINAFALPGGHVVVNRGLIQAAKRPEELAGVLAHELAHVTERHSLRQIIESAGTSLLIQAVFSDASGILGTVGSGTQFLVQQKFSRDFEREADDVGWKYLVDARIDPKGMIEFFQRLESLEKSAAAMAAMNGSLNFLSTHPATRERIERLETKLRAMPAKSDYLRLAD